MYEHTPFKGSAKESHNAISKEDLNITKDHHVGAIPLII